MTAEFFLNSLVKVMYRIKYNDQWYELRVAESIIDKPFVDRDGKLFGVKNAKINFYVFKEGTTEIADWVPSVLKEIYTRYNYAKLSEVDVEICFGVSYSLDFVHNILAYDEISVYNQNGEEIEEWSPDMIF